ncbi:MAG: DapH/DapD/GlmU-related protein [Aulosira sp. DedQUE10]|nr:DapH/DapD/GlmU-related protein [Aulosira sp. DedQUE10]
MHNIKEKIRYKLYQYINSLICYGQQIDKYHSFCKNAQIHPSAKIDPKAGIANYSDDSELIKIGENSVIRGELIVFADAGKIKIGKCCYLGEGSRIWSADSIDIGDRVLISHNVNIHDTNSHPLEPLLRHQHFAKTMSDSIPVTNNFNIKSQAVVIEDDVWIGFNSTILKGVKVGKCSIIAACSVVTKDVPEFSIVTGNPAKVIRRL